MDALISINPVPRRPTTAIYVFRLRSRKENIREPSVASSEVADGLVRSSGFLTGGARDDDDVAAAAAVVAAAVAAAAAEHAFVAWPTTRSPMASNPKTSRPLPRLKS